MKKVFPILLILFALSLIIQYVVNELISEHVVEYSIKTKDNSYMIKETFDYADGENYYDFTVSDKDDLFYTFTFKNDFNRQERIIKDIKMISSNDLHCIYPIFRRNKVDNIQCLYQGNQVSYSYLEQIGNEDIKVITNELTKQNKKYNNPDWNDTETIPKDAENSVVKAYVNNVMEDYVFTIWNYTGLVLVRKGDVHTSIFLSRDQYDNVNSALVDKYYITVVDGVDDFNYFKVYNVKDIGKKDIYTEGKNFISRDFYINGVYKDKMYLTDITNKKQYEVDPVREIAKVVGDEEKGFKRVKNGKLITEKASLFINNKIYFENTIVDKRFIELGAKEVRQDGAFYYFITEKGEVMRCHEDKIYRPVKLFELEGLTEWIVRDGEILVIAKDTIYFFNERTGLKKIAENAELSYNHKNIVDFWKK